jgi:hypothetical protein
MAPGELAAGAIESSRAGCPAHTEVRAGFTIFLIALLLSASLSGAAPTSQPTAESPCDPKLIPPKGDPLAYGRRGERCEGLYVLEVAGSGDLSVVAFTAPAAPFTLKADDRLHVRWPQVPGNLPVRLRAVSLRPHVYYRMDAVRAAGTDGFDWPASLAVQLNLGAVDLGIVGWVQQTVGEKADDVYVPVRIGTSSELASKGYYVAQVVPGAELSKLFVTIAAVGRDGRDEKYLKRDEPLAGFYPSGRPITVKFPVLPAAGLYRVRLGAVLKSGGAANKAFVFYHAGV